MLVANVGFMKVVFLVMLACHVDIVRNSMLSLFTAYVIVEQSCRMLVVGYSASTVAYLVCSLVNDALNVYLRSVVMYLCVLWLVLVCLR